MLAALFIALTLAPAQLTSELQWLSVGPAITGGRIDDIGRRVASGDYLYRGGDLYRAATGGRRGEQPPELVVGQRRPIDGFGFWKA